MCLIEISMYYIEISTSLFRDIDIVIRDLDLLIYSNSRSRIVFLIYYFFSMSLIRFRTIVIHPSVNIVLFGIHRESIDDNLSILHIIQSYIKDTNRFSQ